MCGILIDGKSRRIGRIFGQNAGRIAGIERTEIFPVVNIGRRPAGKLPLHLLHRFKSEARKATWSKIPVPGMPS